MTVMNTVNEGYNITKKSWLSQSVFAVIFLFIFGLIMLAFSYLVSTSSALKRELSNPSEGLVITNLNSLLDSIVKNPIFWTSIYLLLIITLFLGCIQIGMLQFIGINKYSTNNQSLGTYFIYPFKNGRLIPFLFLAFFESLVIGIIGAILILLQDVLYANYQTTTIKTMTDVLTNFFTWQNLVYSISSFIILLIFVPPFFISCFAIIHDKAHYSSFIYGWKSYFKSFFKFEEITFVSFIPIGGFGIIVVLIGLLVASMTGFTNAVDLTAITANNMSLMLSLSIIVFILTFYMLLFFLPLFLNIIGEKYEEQQTKQ